MREENILKDLDKQLAKFDFDRANLVVQIKDLRNSKSSQKTKTELSKLLGRIPVSKIPNTPQEKIARNYAINE